MWASLSVRSTRFWKQLGWKSGVWKLLYWKQPVRELEEDLLYERILIGQGAMDSKKEGEFRSDTRKYFFFLRGW